jgi:hypothetical protein
MLMHTGPTEVMKWETRFSFVSGLIRVPYSLGRGQSFHLDLHDHSGSKRKLDLLPIVSYFHPTFIKLIMYFMYLFYIIMLLMNHIN